MPETVTHRSFDYKSLDPATAQFVQQKTEQINLLFRQTIENILRGGEYLRQVKARLNHGQWLAWLGAEYPFDERTALNHMWASEHFKFETVSDLHIAAKALYKLASPSTPEGAREEAIARAKAGERITPATAEELRDKYVLLQTETKPELNPPVETDLPESPPEPEIQPSQSQFYPQPPVQPLVQTLPREEPKTTTPRQRKRAKEEKPLVVTPKRVHSGEWWKLGKDNYLYCGDPDSNTFQRMLPETLALSLLSPPKRDAWSKTAPSNATSVVSVLTRYEDDQELSLLREIIERYILLYTDPAENEDTIALSFLPDPAVLPLIQQLDCHFYCADPDPKRCDDAVRVWLAVGQSAERMQTRQGKKRSVPVPTK